MTASQVLCFSCIWMELNLRWMMPTMRSISLGEMGRVRDCSLSRFITWVVNSLHAWVHRQTGFIKRITIVEARRLQTEQEKKGWNWISGEATPSLVGLGLLETALADTVTAAALEVMGTVWIKAADSATPNKCGGGVVQWRQRDTRCSLNIKKTSLQWMRKCDKWGEI